MHPPLDLNIVLYIRNQNIMVALHSDQSNWTRPPPSPTRTSNKSNTSSAASLYYARTVNLTVLLALSTIASEQAKGTESTMKKCKQLLGYLATHPNATVRFHASNMILNVHSDTSYLSEANTHSQACGHFFHGLETGRY
jgi:hypothetical protein